MAGTSYSDKFCHFRHSRSSLVQVRAKERPPPYWRTASSRAALLERFEGLKTGWSPAGPRSRCRVLQTIGGRELMVFWLPGESVLHCSSRRLDARNAQPRCTPAHLRYNPKDFRYNPKGRVEAWRGIPKVKPICCPRFLWECLTSRTVNPFPAPGLWRSKCCVFIEGPVKSR
jgi:hypothetical protein